MILGMIVAESSVCIQEMLAESGMSLIDWEASWAESGTAMAAGMAVAAAVAIIAILVIKKKADSAAERV